MKKKSAIDKLTDSQAKSLGISLLTVTEIALIDKHDILGAIKSVRERTGRGLRAAKDLVDAYRDSREPAPDTEWIEGVDDYKLDLIFAALAHGVVNISSGLNTIEEGSRIHRAMSALCTLRSKHRLELMPEFVAQTRDDDMAPTYTVTELDAVERSLLEALANVRTLRRTVHP